MRAAGWPTVAGIALQVIAGGLAGILFGAAFAQIQNVTRLLLLGVIWGISWFYILQALSRTIARLVPVYVPESALLGAHTVFGLILGWWLARDRVSGAPGPRAAYDGPDRPPSIG